MRDIRQQYDTLREIITEAWELRPFFVTVTGVDLYGFSSLDSDYDLRGAFMLPLRDLLGIWPPKETMTRLEIERGLDMDLVLHGIRKFAAMMADGNGAILEEALSPLVLLGEEVAAPLQELARQCLSRKLFYHYNGFSRNQIEKLWKEEPRRLKTLLYIYRILMTGVHVLETGELQMNLPLLNERFGLAFIPDLIAAKVTELAPVGEADWEMHRKAIRRLQQRLRRAHQASPLPQEPQSLAELEDLVVELRCSRLFAKSSACRPA